MKDILSKLNDEITSLESSKLKLEEEYKQMSSEKRKLNEIEVIENHI